MNDELHQRYLQTLLEVAELSYKSKPDRVRKNWITFIKKIMQTK